MAPRLRILIGALVIIATVGLSACATGTEETTMSQWPPTHRDAVARVTVIDNIDGDRPDLASAFNRGRDGVRLVMILSPT